MISELVPLLVPIFSTAIVFSIPIIWIVLNYRKRCQLMELYHRERMAAIERGMELPPLPIDLIDGRSKRRRSSLLPGLVWFFIGMAVFVGWLITGFDDDLPVHADRVRQAVQFDERPADSCAHERSGSRLFRSAVQRGAIQPKRVLEIAAEKLRRLGRSREGYL